MKVPRALDEELRGWVLLWEFFSVWQWSLIPDSAAIMQAIDAVGG